MASPRLSELSLPRALSGFAIAIALVSPAIGCRQRALPVREGCRTPEVVSCLQSYALKELDHDALERLDTEVVWGECFAKEKEQLARQSSCLPLEMGVDPQIGEMVEVRYFQLSYHRGGGGVAPFYPSKVYRERCCEIGGAPLTDIASNRYLGCMPLVSRTREHRSRVCRTSD